MSLKSIWSLTKRTFKDFFERKCVKLSASLAFFTIFSLPGFLIIIIWISTLFFGREVVEGSLYGQMESFIGHEAAVDLQKTIRNARVSGEGTIATIIGLVSLIFGATSVFSEIQDSINRIWHLKARPREGRGFIRLLVNRLISFSMIISLGFILLVSLILNGAMDMVLDDLMSKYPQLTVMLAYILNLVVTFFITAFIFAAIFKVLPDAKVKWKDVWVGAVVTTILFILARFGIGYYLGNNRMSSAYGAAGSVIVMLLWVYFSAMILYLGATFTRVYVIHKGRRIYPNNYAVWVQQIEKESGTSIDKQPEDKTIG
jgi:membrane protein